MEIWKDVKGYEGFYQVSNIGMIKSFYGKNEKIRKPQKHGQGYLIVGLGRSNTKLIHRLVAIAFIPNPNNLEFVNHKNGIKTDNQVQNLEWVTRQGNEDHAFKTALKNSTGSRNTQAKLTEMDVIEIKRNNSNLSSKEMAQKYSVSVATINRVKQGVIWGHVKYSGK